MKTIRMAIEVEYDEEIMYGNDRDAKDWFFNSILKTGDLFLHSDEIGIPYVRYEDLKRQFMKAIPAWE